MDRLPVKHDQLLQELHNLRQRNTELEKNRTWLLQTIEQLKKTEGELAEKFINRTVELSKERQRLFAILDSLPFHVSLFAPDHKVIFANRAFRDQHGESNGQACYEYIFGLNQPCAYCETFAVFETGQPHRWHMTTPDGRQVEVYNIPFLDTDGADLVLETSIDHTQHYQLMEELQKSEKRCQLLFHNSPEMISVISMQDGTYLDVNQRFLDCMGYTRAEIINRTPMELGIWENDPLTNHSIRRELEEINQEHTAEYRIRKKSGQLITVSASSMALYLDNELCRICMMRDISREKKMEAGLEKLDRLNIIGQMAASISHEIRNPMTSVRGFLQMMRNYERYQEDGEYFDLMIEEIDRANGIISDYLGMARDNLLFLDQVSLDEIIASLTPMIRSDANQREISIHLELGNVPLLHLYENEIRQLILNLARNGLEAMGSHGELAIGTCVEGREVVLYVRDQGTGIPEEVAEKLPTPFFTTKESGTGLGLSVCYSIAARHRAHIDYETGAQGTAFFVRFPTDSAADSITAAEA